MRHTGGAVSDDSNLFTPQDNVSLCKNFIYKVGTTNNFFFHLAAKSKLQFNSEHEKSQRDDDEGDPHLSFIMSGRSKCQQSVIIKYLKLHFKVDNIF